MADDRIEEVAEDAESRAPEEMPDETPDETPVATEQTVASRWLLAGVTLMGVFVAALPHYVFPVCEFAGVFRTGANGEPLLMGCHQTAVVAVWMGAALAGVGVAGAIAGTREMLRACGALAFVGGLATIALPLWIAPVCASAVMPCAAGTLPGLVVSGLLIAVLGAGTVLLTLRRGA